MGQTAENFKIFYELIDTLDNKYQAYFEEFGRISDYYFLGRENHRLTIFIDKNLPSIIVSEIYEVFEVAFN